MSVPPVLQGRYREKMSKLEGELINLIPMTLSFLGHGIGEIRWSSSGSQMIPTPLLPLVNLGVKQCFSAIDSREKLSNRERSYECSQCSFIHSIRGRLEWEIKCCINWVFDLIPRVLKAIKPINKGVESIRTELSEVAKPPWWPLDEGWWLVRDDEGRWAIEDLLKNCSCLR